MSDHIIKAAKAAGGTTYTNRHYPDAPAAAFGPEALRDFYAAAYRAGMEDAANIVQANAQMCATGGYGYALLSSNAAAIRAHAQNQPKNEHDSGVV